MTSCTVDQYWMAMIFRLGWQCIQKQAWLCHRNTAWAQEHLQKINVWEHSLLYRLKLYAAKKKPCVNMIQNHRYILWTRGHLTLTEPMWKTFYTTWRPHPHAICLFLLSLMVWGCISAYETGSFHIWIDTTIAEKYLNVLEQNMLQSSHVPVFFREQPAYFS